MAGSSVTVTDEFAQRGRRGTFRDPRVEAEFRRWRVDQTVSTARIIAGGSAVLWACLPLIYGFFLDDPPQVLAVGSWGIAAPALGVVTVGSYTGLRRWTSAGVAVVGVIVGLDAVWVATVMYGPYSGAVALLGLVVAFQAIFIRVAIEAAAFVTCVLFGVPIALQITGTLDGEVPLYESFLIIFALAANAPVAVLATVRIETGMRQQFAARGQLQASQRLIRRYVPEQVADAVLSGANETVERHERRKLTIFFSDLVGFTDLSEELEPEDLANVLHDYFTEMNAIARKHGGTVDDLVGDAILVLFGAPERTDDRDQALRAVRMAVEMQEAMGPLNQRWEAAGIPETLRVRMGINTGVATVGNFGSAERTKYTALGKQVNVAARIQAQCDPGKVLISHPTWLLVRDEIACTPMGELTLKGLHKPMPAHEVVSSEPR
jgi:class 3 adenylate cyclase